MDYSVLPIDELLKTLQSNLDARFPENEFEQGYSDHFISTATWRFLKQKEDFLGACAKLLASQGTTKIADKLMPGIRFIISFSFRIACWVSFQNSEIRSPISYI